jgi:hypothetical protein
MPLLSAHSDFEKELAEANRVYEELATSIESRII